MNASYRMFALLLTIALYSNFINAQEHHAMDGDIAMQKLVEGNLRYVEGKTIHPNQDGPRRDALAKGQSPFAVIIGCSDSRVPPEVIFDQGLGDLFVIRLAGNIVDDFAIGSIEYAAEHLGTPLIIVLGHESCGAVSAAVSGSEIPGHIKTLVEEIQPAVDKAKSSGGDVLENAIKFNVEAVVEKLKTSHPILDHLVEEGDLKIIGARYDLDEGVVTFYK